MRKVSANAKNKIPLIEAALSAVIFVIASVILATAYVKADSFKGEAQFISEATIRCEDVAEKLKLSRTGLNGSYDTPFGSFRIVGEVTEVLHVDYDREWNVTDQQPYYVITVSACSETLNDMTILKYEVSAIDKKGNTIVSLPSYIIPGFGE